MKTPVRRLEATFASVLVIALAVTGCGSSSSKASPAAGSSSAAAAGTTSSAATSAAAPTSTAAAASTGAAATSAPAAASSAATSSTPAAAPPPSAAAVTSVKATGGGAFCKTLAAFINSSQSFGTTPAEVKQSVQKSQAATLVLLSEAPSAIKTDLTTLFNSLNGLYAALAKANYDYTKVPPSALTSMQTPATETAEARADAYVKTSCGINVGPSS